MELKNWFVLSDDKIIGPFKPSEILKELADGKWSQSRFWSKGKPYWMSAIQFHEDLDKQKRQNESNSSGTITWYIKENEKHYGPLKFEELLSFLRKKPNYKNIHVSNESSQGWREVYQIESLMEKLGVNRRTYPRVPIDGTITILEGFLKGKKAPLISLSQGGLGAKELRGLSIGEKVKGVFNGTNLNNPIHFQGEVVFLNPEGGFGLKFTNISTESLSLIIAYVKQFVELHPEIDFQKIA